MQMCTCMIFNKAIEKKYPTSEYMLNKLYFGILSWGNAGKSALQKTVTLQKRHQFGINGQAIYLKIQPVINLEIM